MKEINFDLRDQEYIELNKLIKLLGLSDTGGEAKMLIENGLVKVNNSIEFQKRKKLRPGDEILISNHRIIMVQGE